MIDGNPTFSQVESIGSQGVDYMAQGTDGNYYVGIEEVPVYGQDGFQNNAPEESSWWSRNSDWLLPIIGGIGSAATGAWLPALIGGAFGIWSNYQQNEYNKEQYERERQDALEAEKRANAEYDRRQAAAQEYNDSWDQRLISKGYSPYAALNKGQGVTSTSPSAPSPIQMPHGIPRQSAMNSIGTATQIAQQLASARQTAAQTRLTNAQAEVVEKESIGFWQRFHNEMDAVLANTRNTTAKAAISESQFVVQVATESAQIQEAVSAAGKMYYQMRAAEYEPEFANARLADMYIEIECAALRQYILANESAMSDNALAVQEWEMNDIIAYYEARAENDVAAREALAQIRTAEYNASLLRKSDEWFNANQWKDMAQAVLETGSTLVSRGKSSAFGKMTHTSTTKRVIGDDVFTDTHYYYGK